MKFNTEIIDKYVQGQLSESEKKDFDTELANNKNLRKELEIQREIMKGIELYGIRTEISQSISKLKVKKLIRTITLATFAVALLAGGVYILVNGTGKSKKSEVLYQLNEKGESNWSEADKMLKSQLFTIDPKKDTIIETKSGIILQIAANAFLNGLGEAPDELVNLEVKEAMTPSEIIQAGLSTTSNGLLLETGGMFYINARSGEKNLDMDQSKPIMANVPNQTNKDMSLFVGERKKDGQINWINPKPMKKQLATVDVTKLNFYPPNFLDSLEGMGFDVKNKVLTDSVYYSFASQKVCGETAYPAPQPAAQSQPKDSASSIKMVTGVAVEKKDEGNPTPVFNLTSSMSTLKGNISKEPVLDGEKLFKQNCSVCHAAHSNQKLTGPGLLGVEERAPKGDWLLRFTLNSEKVIKSGDKYANKIYKENGKAAMTVYEGQLSEADVKAIFEYIHKVKPPKLPLTKESCIAEINPASIKAIWDPKFNNTIVATKEFEERLQVIFKTCNASLLSLYTQNLNSNLYELDSMAAFVIGGEAKEKFVEFYKRRDGGVDITDEQNASLQRYLKEKKSIYEEAITQAMEKMYKKERELIETASLKESEHVRKFSEDQSKLMFEEIEANMDEAYRQLGKIRPKVAVSVPARSYFRAPLSNPGWYNVDRYVVESTVNRSTLNYTDTLTGKTALIEYTLAKVKVKDYEAYDKLVCYLLTDKLSSFQLMKDSAQVFSERLNQTFGNSIIVVGYKGEKTFYADEKYAKAQEYEFGLTEIDPEVLVRRINQRYNFQGTRNVLDDIDFSIFQQKEKKRLAKIEAREKLRARMFSVVYPCKKYDLGDIDDLSRYDVAK